MRNGLSNCHTDLRDDSGTCNFRGATSEAPWDSVEELHTQEGCEWDGCRRDFMTPIEIGVRGPDILHNPFFNKGTAFKTEERDRLRFRGLLPARFNNIKMQIDRFLVTLRATESDIQKNILLEDLHDLNETLYHRILVDHIEGTTRHCPMVWCCRCAWHLPLHRVSKELH